MGIRCVRETGRGARHWRVCWERARACPSALRKPEAALRSSAAVPWPTPCANSPGERAWTAF